MVSEFLTRDTRFNPVMRGLALPVLAPEWYKCSFSWGRISLGGRPQVLAERATYPIVMSIFGAHS